MIAAALVAIVAQLAVMGAKAQFGFALECDGSFNAPCYISLIN